MLRSRVQQRAFEGLERCALKRARTVLRGLRVSNDPRLPDDYRVVITDKSVALNFNKRIRLPERRRRRRSG